MLHVTDLVGLTHWLLSENQEVRNDVRMKYRHILVRVVLPDRCTELL